jgi:glycosyltransferase 2 family protein
VTRRLVLVAVALGILGWLWASVGWNELSRVVRGLDGGLFLAACALFVPQTLLSGWRWSLLVGPWQRIPLGRSTALVLAASSMNVVLPSKMGDVAKGFFLRRDLPGGDATTGLALAAFEKGLDTAALAAWMVGACLLDPPSDALGWGLLVGGAVGLVAFLLLLSRPAASRAARMGAAARAGIAGAGLRLLGRAGEAILLLRGRRGRFAAIVAASLVLWGLHLLQFSLVHRAAGGTAPEAALWRAVPMAIFVGLLPVTFAGVGTRDAAMVWFLGRAAGEGVALALGAFATLRYLVPALAGLPFLAALRRPSA